MKDTNLNRRSLARGAAWAAPVVLASSAVPAYASSCNTIDQTFKTLHWLSASGGTTATGEEGLSANQVSSQNARLRRDNMTLVDMSASGLSEGQWLYLHQAQYSTRAGATQTISITLPEEAHCVSFYVQDVDTQSDRNTGRRYRDQVTVPGFTASAVNPAYIQIEGSTARASHDAALEGKANEYEWGWESTNGAVLYQANGPVSSIELTFQNVCGSLKSDVNNTQHIGVSAIRYSTTPECVQCQGGTTGSRSAG
ncbi:hypothetical protein [Rothia sp. P4278]|uniref:hypothetical protein n=1 Tax=Rothia sp. P4278 TaxID=3402658 RepID=UPI003AE7837C